MKILSYGKNKLYHYICDICEAEFEFTDIDVYSINKGINFSIVENNKLEAKEVFKDEPYIRFVSCPACGSIILLDK